MDNIEEILNRLYQELRITKDTEFCDKYDVKKNTLSTWKKRNSIPYELIGEISQNENLSLDWILTGRKEKSVYQKNSSAISDVSTVIANMYEDVYAAAGYGGNGDDYAPPIPVQIDERLLRDVFNVFSTKSIDIINVTGDSMEPFIKNGEKVIVERTQQAYENNLVIAMVDNELFVKRLIKDPLGRWAKLTSMNEFYPDIMLEGDDLKRLRIIGIVRGQWRPR